MIEAKNVTMHYDDCTALSHLNCQIPSGCIYGLVGSNGSGKSTFLRLISGVYRPSEGQIFIDGTPVYDHPEVKQSLFFIPDELFFLPQATLDRTAGFYQNLYPGFSMKRYKQLTKTFGLNPRATIQTFSKGMRRQAATILGLSVMPKYLFFDETFDGLDPIMRNLVKDVLRQDVSDYGTTVIIASHSLLELEDTCDQLALLHRGGIVFESDISHMKTSLFKVQFAMNGPYDESIFLKMDTRKIHRKGAITELIVRGDQERVLSILQEKNPILLEILPLGLEEIFVYEMEALGYDFANVLR